MKKEKRGRKKVVFEPVKKEHGKWFRLVDAERVSNRDRLTIKSAAQRNKIKTKIEGGVTFYWMKKLIE